jgi:Protein of unknown function (DUF1592)/Protein of unknown function (DUF1588)/Protein of unknown function (DUF1585)/Protein of unknown function (DUF1587)/Protein of unknown function (DUF1595)
MKRLAFGGIVTFFAALACAQPAAPKPLSPTEQRTLIDKNCAMCHNDKLKSGGLTLTKLDLSHPEQTWELSEKVIAKVRSGLMPPAGLPRPDKATMSAFAAGIEQALDAYAATHPDPGRPSLHRLNRLEYANSVHDLLGLDIDPAKYLPNDDSSHGFDNMAEVLNFSPTLMEGYVRAAGAISRLAVGDPGITPLVETYHIPQSISQTEHVDGTPFGTRGGLVIHHNFPADGEYVFTLTFYYSSIGPVFGASQKPGEEKVEIAVNGERVALLTFNPKMKVDDDLHTIPIRIKAGPQVVSISFLQTFSGPVEDFQMPFDQSLADLSTGHIPGLTAIPHLRDAGINGPYNVTGVGDTPSRRKILSCRPTSSTDEITCAKKIIATLAREAYRRPVDDSDMEMLLSLFQTGRNHGDFDSGIRLVVQAMVADPQFVFRFERPPADALPGSNFRISDLELASRLSYFLWSSPPDDPLITLASQNKLHQPAVLEGQVQRMLADPRSSALATNFAVQWLGLRNLRDMQPDVFVFPNWDRNLTQSMEKETELFFESIMHEDRNIVDLLTANYTFVDERLAKHYGIPDIIGTRFRRVTLTDENRYGLLGQGSVLMATSLANRTSPVQRGKWVLEQILGVSAPTPPPNVPALKENKEGDKVLSVRERLEAHRTNEPCHSCHQIMDPLGFALDNFDATGAWRIHDGPFPVDPEGQLYDGTKVSGPVSLRNALVARSDIFVRNFTVKLLTYALGRGVEYHDMPVVRAIDRQAQANDNRFSSLVLGIVRSTPFMMRRAEERDATSSDVAPAAERQ